MEQKWAFSRRSILILMMGNADGLVIVAVAMISMIVVAAAHLVAMELMAVVLAVEVAMIATM